jgi:hypothetical protein
MNDYEKYAKVHGYVTSINIFMCVILAIFFGLQNETLIGFAFVSGIISSFLKLLDHKNKTPILTKTTCYINCALLFFLLGGISIFYLGKVDQSSNLPEGIKGFILRLFIFSPIFCTFIYVFYSILRITNLEDSKKNLESKVASLKDTIHDYSTKNGYVDFNELLKIMDVKKANVLMVTGNLLGLKTEDGCELLIKLLQKKTNQVHLVIPKDSEGYLTEIKQIILRKNQIDILKRIFVSVYEVLWNLQGVVIIGRIRDSGTGANDIDPVGIFYYKIKQNIEDSTPDDGIYVDLEKYKEEGSTPGHQQAIQAVCAYYHLSFLTKSKEFEYSNGDFKVKKYFTKEGTDYNKELIKPINWDKII